MCHLPRRRLKRQERHDHLSPGFHWTPEKSLTEGCASGIQPEEGTLWNSLLTVVMLLVPVALFGKLYEPSICP